MPFSEFFKRLIAVVVVVLIVWGMWAARSTLLMGFAAALLAVALSMPTRRLQKWGWRRSWAIATSVVAMLLLVAVVSLLIVPRLVTETLALVTSIPDAIRVLFQFYARVRTLNPLLEVALPPPGAYTDAVLTTERARQILGQLVDTSLAIAPRLLGGVGRAISILINIGFILFIAVFFLIDPRTYVQASLFLMPQRYHRRAIAIWQELYDTIVSWISTLALSISVTVALVLVILGWLLNMPNAVVVAVFAGAATFVPNIGAFLPLIPITIFTLADDPARLLILVPAYLAIQLTESNVITPSLIKSGMNIPAGAMLLFQLLATLAFGALGLLLAVPLFGILIILVREIYSYGWLGLRDTALAVHADSEGHLTLIEVSPAQPPTADVPFVGKERD